MDAFLSTILLWAANFAPRGWAFCSGQLLSISQNTALFSLLGTMYGGDGQTTFSLPDLRGRTALGSDSMGTGRGLSSYPQGSMGGSETVTLIGTQIPAHTHDGSSLKAGVSASTSPGTEGVPGTNNANTLGATTARGAELYVNAAPNVSLQGAGIGGTTGAYGGNQPHENRMPYTAVNYILAMEGIFPSRA